MPEQESETFGDPCARCAQQGEEVTLDLETRGPRIFFVCRTCGFEASDHDYSHAKLTDDVPAYLEEVAKLRGERRYLSDEIYRLRSEYQKGVSKPGSPADNQRLMEKSQLLTKLERRLEAVEEELERLTGHRR